MKIRLDYVSNSSSSSFMLVGNVFGDDAIKDAWKKLHPNDIKDISSWEAAEDLADELSLKLQHGVSNYYDNWVLGLEFDDMEENETKQQFKDRIKAALSKAFTNVNVNACVDGGYDG